MMEDDDAGEDTTTPPGVAQLTLATSGLNNRQKHTVSAVKKTVMEMIQQAQALLAAPAAHIKQYASLLADMMKQVRIQEPTVGAIRDELRAAGRSHAMYFLRHHWRTLSMAFNKHLQQVQVTHDLLKMPAGRRQTPPPPPVMSPLRTPALQRGAVHRAATIRAGHTERRLPPLGIQHPRGLLAAHQTTPRTSRRPPPIAGGLLSPGTMNIAVAAATEALRQKFRSEQQRVSDAQDENERLRAELDRLGRRRSRSHSPSGTPQAASTPMREDHLLLPPTPGITASEPSGTEQRKPSDPKHVYTPGGVLERLM